MADDDKDEKEKEDEDEEEDDWSDDEHSSSDKDEDDDEDDDRGSRRRGGLASRSRRDSRRPFEGFGGSTLFRIILGFLSEPALTLGQKIGTDTAFIVSLLDKIESFIGPQLTNMLVTETGEWVRIPDFIKRVLVKKGFPPALIDMVNSLLEEVFEGIWAARKARQANPKEPLTQADVKAGFENVKDKLQNKILQEKGRLMSAMKDIDPAKRAAFLKKAASLTDEDKKKFEFYRPLIAGEAWMIEQLADTDTANWIAYLGSVLGPEPAKSPESKIAEMGHKAAGKIAAALDHVVEHPAEILDRTAESVGEISDHIRNRNVALERKLAALKKTRR